VYIRLRSVVQAMLATAFVRVRLLYRKEEEK